MTNIIIEDSVKKVMA